jgi:ABC-type uncharacterized transport system fused permease/ATPase subunit
MSDQTTPPLSGDIAPAPDPTPVISIAEWAKDVTRWIVPVIVGWLVSLINHYAWLTTWLGKLNIHTDSASVTGYVTVLVALIYAGAARIFEAKFPKQLSWLLGFAKRANILKS